jgi:hypothetical protein
MYQILSGTTVTSGLKRVMLSLTSHFHMKPRRKHNSSTNDFLFDCSRQIIKGATENEYEHREAVKGGSANHKFGIIVTIPLEAGSLWIQRRP